MEISKKNWAQRIRNITPYVPGEQPKDRKYIKLNTNENPYPPSPAVSRAIRAVSGDLLRLYPDPECSALRDVLAAQYGVKPEMVFTGNGSDEVLAFAFLAFTDQSIPALFPDITYSFYEVYAAFFQGGFRVIPVDENFRIPLSELSKNEGTVVLTNPNAPTGIAVGLEEVRKLCDSNPDHVVIVDEAYVDFGAESAVPLVGEKENLLVVHTFSKSRALAGIRCGYAIGAESLISALNAVKNSINSYTLDRLTLAAACAAAEDSAYRDEICGKVRRTRARTVEALQNMGFSVLPSSANFVFATHEAAYAGDLFRELRSRGILVRYFPRDRIDNYLRITIGTDEEMDAMLESLHSILEGAK